MRFSQLAGGAVFMYICITAQNTANRRLQPTVDVPSTTALLHSIIIRCKINLEKHQTDLNFSTLY